MKPEMLSVLACPECAAAGRPGGFPLLVEDDRLCCPDCEWQAPIQNDIPVLTDPPGGIIGSEKIERGPNTGTPWRQANWRFLQQQINRLPSDALILDAGAGRGDFSAALAGRKSIALDIYPYPEVDLVCDLTAGSAPNRMNPFQPASFDAILLLNVLEHIFDTQQMIAVLAQALKPGGILIVAIPFLVKLHQTPVDYVRYTQFALSQIGDPYGLEVISLEGYYDPVFLLGEGLGAIRWTITNQLTGGRRFPARLLLSAISLLSGMLNKVLGPGQARPVALTQNPAPTGYQIVYRCSTPARCSPPAKKPG